VHNSEALYYPEIEPPMRWLRSAALFFDKVRSFVPADAERSLSTELQEFAERTEAWIPYRPNQATASLLDVPDQSLDEVFKEIATNRSNKLTFVIGRHGEVQVSDHVFMHASKLCDRVQDRLRAHGLVLPHEFAGDEWLIVNKRASDLILSYISDRLAALEGWTSITDNEGCYIFNAIYRGVAESLVDEPADQVARMLVTNLVPDVIDTISIERYCELRSRYAPIRERLNAFINDIVVENRLGHAADEGKQRQMLQDCIDDLRTEVVTFRESTFGRTFRRWGPFSICSLISMATPLLHLNPAWAVSVTGVTVVVRGVEKAGLLDRTVTKRGEMVRLLAAARSDILDSVNISRFLVA